MGPESYNTCNLLTKKEAKATGSILGQVIDAKTGVELPDANVFIAETKKNAVTDENGYFVLEDIPVGTYVLTAQIIGYQTLVNNKVAVVQGHTTRHDCELELMYPALEGYPTIISTGKVIGRVTDAPTGEGLPYAKVVIVGTRMSAVTNEDGKFTIENVPRGTYRLEATMIGYKNSVAKHVLVIPGRTTVTKIKLNIEIRNETIIIE